MALFSGAIQMAKGVGVGVCACACLFSKMMF